MAFSLSPSVEVIEKDLSLTIPNLPTSRTGIVLPASKGPALKITPIASEAELVNTFGKPTSSNAKQWFNAWNFLQYSSSLYVVRPIAITDGEVSATNATAKLTQNATSEVVSILSVDADGLMVGAQFTAAPAASDYNDEGNGKIKINQTLTGTTSAGWLKVGAVVYPYSGWAISSGTIFTLDGVTIGVGDAIAQNTIIYDCSAADGTAKAPSYVAPAVDGYVLLLGADGLPVAKTGGFQVYQIKSTADTATNKVTIDSSEVFMTCKENVVEAHDTNEDVTGYYNDVVAESSLTTKPAAGVYQFIQKDVSNTFDLAVAVCSDAAYWKGPLFKKIELPVTADVSPAIESTWEDLDAPTNFNALFDYEPNWSNGEFAVVVLQQSPTTLTYSVVEKYIVSYTEGARNEFNVNIYAPEYILKNSNYIYLNMGTMTTAQKLNSSTEFFGSFKLTGTIDLDPIGIQEYAFAADLFNDAESFDINLLISDCDNSAYGGNVANIFSTIAESRKDCVAIVSPFNSSLMVGKSASAATANIIREFGTTGGGAGTFTTFGTYSAVYGNMKYQYDKFNDVNRWLPIGGDIAGLYAQTDKNRDPWWAPAGLERGKIKNAIKVAYAPNKANRDDLYVAAVNPVLSITGEGTAIVFGQKTATMRPSAFDRVNVRRLLITLEKAIATACRYVLFEFNDDFTRNRVKGFIEPFLRMVKGRRGIYDFLVVCDTSNNTGQIIDANALVIDIFIKPTRVAEFIQINMNVLRTDASFSELVGKA